MNPYIKIFENNMPKSDINFEPFCEYPSLYDFATNEKITMTNEAWLKLADEIKKHVKLEKTS